MKKVLALVFPGGARCDGSFRKGGATIAAENGATPYQLMSIFGWKTLEQAKLYTKKVRQQLVSLSAWSEHRCDLPHGGATCTTNEHVGERQQQTPPDQISAGVRLDLCNGRRSSGGNSPEAALRATLVEARPCSRIRHGRLVPAKRHGVA